MPIKIPDNLPAAKVLESENIFFITENRAARQDIRPLQILVLNLMPTKIETETQLLRLLGNTPLQVNIDFLQTSTYIPKNISQEHLLQFYNTFDEVRQKRYDGFIITGAPVETMDFEEVEYWDELCEIMRWSKSHVFSTMHICWGSQAGLYFHYGLPKYPMERKLSGIYELEVVDARHPLLRGFDEHFRMPHSRHTCIREKDIAKLSALQILAKSDEAGAAIVATKDSRQIFISGHMEYDRNTLAQEYRRDLSRGLQPDIPAHYFPDDDPEQKPPFDWRGHANLMFANWLNIVYQQTPFDLNTLI